MSNIDLKFYVINNELLIFAGLKNQINVFCFGLKTVIFDGGKTVFLEEFFTLDLKMTSIFLRDPILSSSYYTFIGFGSFRFIDFFLLKRDLITLLKIGQ